MMNGSIITINYYKGNFTVDLDKILPCSQKDFRMILSMVDQTMDPVSIAQELMEYINKQLDPETMKSSCYVHKIKVESYEKKMNALRNILIDTYGLTVEKPIEKKEEQPKVKKAVVYKIIEKNGVKSIECVPGWTFEKGGYTFTVHKYDRYYIVSIYGVAVNGSRVHTNKQSAISSINDEILSMLSKMSENLETIKADFEQLMIEAGYMDASIVNDSEPIQTKVEAITSNTTDTTVSVEPKTQRTTGLVFHVLFSRTLRVQAHIEKTSKCAMATSPELVRVASNRKVNSSMRRFLSETIESKELYTHTRALRSVSKSAMRTFTDPIAGYSTGTQNAPSIYGSYNGRAKTLPATLDTS